MGHIHDLLWSVRAASPGGPAGPAWGWRRQRRGFAHLQQHLPPWREGWMKAERKSPQSSHRSFLSAISLRSAAPDPDQLLCSLPQKTTSLKEREEEGKKGKDTGHNGIKKGQRLRLNGWLLFFPPPCLLVLFLFWRLPPAAQTPASEERERRRERRRGDERGREKTSHRPTVQKELEFLPNIWMDCERTDLR